MYRKVGIASLIMMGSVFLSRATGLFREMAIAYIGGAGGEVDAYQISFVIPEILNHMVASGFLSVTFIPMFAAYLVRNDEDQGWRVFSIVLNCFGLFLLALIVICEILAPRLISLIAPGLRDPDAFQLAVRMTRIILPAQFFFFAGGMLMAVQFAKEHFFLPALAPLLYNLGIIAGGLLLGPRLGMEGFAWGVLIGAFSGNFLVQLAGAGRLGMIYRLAFNFRHPDLKKYILLTLPLMLGLTMTFSTEFFFRLFGSYLEPGGVAVLNFGLRVMLLLVGLFGQAAGTAAFPYMVRLAGDHKFAEMNQLLNKTLRYLALLIPFSILVMVLRSEVVMMLFQRGEFTAEDTAWTANVLVFFLIGAFAFAAYTVVVRGFYATQNTIFPALYGSLTVLLSIPLYLAGLRLMNAEGIALAISISGILQVTVLYALWNVRSQNAGSAQVYRFYLKMIVLGLFAGLVCFGFKYTLLGGIDTSTFGGSLLVSVLTGLVFLALLLAVGYGLRIREVTDAADHLKNKLL